MQIGPDSARLGHNPPCRVPRLPRPLAQTDWHCISAPCISPLQQHHADAPCTTLTTHQVGPLLSASYTLAVQRHCMPVYLAAFAPSIPGFAAFALRGPVGTSLRPRPIGLPRPRRFYITPYGEVPLICHGRSEPVPALGSKVVTWRYLWQLHTQLPVGGKPQFD